MENLASLLEKATLSGKEKTTEIVPIKGTTVAAFCQFLKYLYTGVCLELNQKRMAKQLFLLADKYAVDTLKEECATKLIQRLAVNNAIKTLILAHQHPSKELFQAALSYISKNSKVICSRSEWLSLMKDYPELCFQATQLIASKEQ